MDPIEEQQISQEAFHRAISLTVAMAYDIKDQTSEVDDDGAFLGAAAHVFSDIQGDPTKMMYLIEELSKIAAAAVVYANGSVEAGIDALLGLEEAVGNK